MAFCLPVTWSDLVDYRLFQSADFEQLYAIEEGCFQPQDRFQRRYMERLVNAASAATWIAEHDGTMAGFAVVEWSVEAGKGAAYIQTIEVAAGYRRRGVGAELLKRVEDSARAAGAEEIWLHVDARNDAAMGLYRTQGYVNEGREEHYYGEGRAGEIYFKSLKAPVDPSE
jgi:ribosomal-protein-alanine N-acetyltransferase